MSTPTEQRPDREAQKRGREMQSPGREVQSPSRDRHGLEVLDPDTCLELIGTVPVGRLAWVSAGRPRILPVNHIVDGDTVAFVTTPGSKLDHALQKPGGAVAYEVDDYDASDHSGWSVVAEGPIEPVMDETEQARLDRLGAPAWIDVFRDRRWVRLRPDELSGRRLPTDLEEGS